MGSTSNAADRKPSSGKCGDLVAARAALKREAFASLLSGAVTKDLAREYLYQWEDPCGCMDALWQLRNYMDRAEWLGLVGNQWPRADDAGSFTQRLRRVLGVRGPIRDLMTVEQQARYDRLPETLVVYRGCSREYAEGASWTLNPEVARTFPFYRPHRAKDLVLVTATVKKANVLALLNTKTLRDQDEVLTFRAKPIFEVGIHSNH